MRDPFNRFALRYLAAVVCGLALLLLHSTAQSGLPAAFVPQCPSPWELSKLAFWPLLAAWVLTGRLGRERRTLLQDLPAAVLTPLAMTAACWGLAAAGGNGAASLAVWAVLLAAVLFAALFLLQFPARMDLKGQKVPVYAYAAVISVMTAFGMNEMVYFCA